MAYAASHQEMRLHAEQSRLVMSTLQVSCTSVSSLPGASRLLSLCAGPVVGCKNGLQVYVQCTQADKVTAGAAERQKPHTGSSY